MQSDFVLEGVLSQGRGPPPKREAAPPCVSPPAAELQLTTEVIGVNGVRAMNGMNWVNMMKNCANGMHLVIGVNWLNEVIEVIGVI